MRRKKSKQDVLQKLRDIALGSCNDAVKLAFMEQGCESGVDELDLTALSEVKRSPSGSVEVKLINRLDALRLLLDVLDREEQSRDPGLGLLEAIVKAAEENAN
ncbi:MAG: hypothetical protein IJ072_03330 [Oscillospiraceae bacterium]|nr:hypothetical protein [Oscillospiraceae bacterium]